MWKTSSDPPEFHRQANHRERNDVLPAQLAYRWPHSPRWQKLEQRCHRNGNAEQHHRIYPAELAAGHGKNEVGHEQKSRKQHSDATVGEKPLEHSRCAEPKKPIRGKQQCEGCETASHVALDADLQGKMASHKPERY